MFLIPGTILAWHITKILLCFIRWQVNSYIFTAPAWTYCKTYCRTAYDVTINDDSWPTEAFELVTGEKSKTLERLDPSVQFVMHLFAIGVSVVQKMISLLLLLQRCHSFTHICPGNQNTGQVPGFASCYYIPCSHQDRSSGFVFYLYCSHISYAMHLVLFSLFYTLQLLDRCYYAKSVFSTCWRRPTQPPSSHSIFSLRDLQRRSLNG